MPFPRTLARINRRITNRVARLVAGRVPPLAIVEHRGRHSGAAYRTPVMVFRSSGGDGFVVALTYGPQADWVRNVLADSGCSLEHGGRRIALTEPRLLHGDEGLASLPGPVRLALRFIRVTDVLSLRGER